MITACTQTSTIAVGPFAGFCGSMGYIDPYGKPLVWV